MLFARTLKLLVSVIGMLALVDEKTSDSTLEYVSNRTYPYDLGTVWLLHGAVNNMHVVKSILLSPIPSASDTYDMIARGWYSEHTRNYTTADNQTFVFVENYDGFMVSDLNDTTVYTFDWDGANESKHQENIYHLAITRLLAELKHKQDIEKAYSDVAAKYEALKDSYVRHVGWLLFLSVFSFVMLSYIMTLRTIEELQYFLRSICFSAFISVVLYNAEIFLSVYEYWSQ